MPDGRELTTIKVIPAINDIAAEQWDACAGPRNPFLSHAFLSALEDSGSASAEEGWVPQHLIIEDEDEDLIAAAPLYLKTHSHGEYIFDWAWADAYHRAGGEYYPKLLCAVPFTPASGPRLLVRPDADPDLADVLIRGMIQLAQKIGLSSLHINFLNPEQFRRCADNGMLLRVGRQFHWENRDYQTFDDFLGDLSSRKRKAIRKERRAVAESGVELKIITGDELTEEHWDAFFRFYRDTTDRKWGQRYLTRRFFSLLGDRMGDRVALILAVADGAYVGGALNLIGDDTLFGRYWGSTEDYKFLHFEACYYRAIDFAIERGLKWVEAGAQGPHKIQRGYLPRETYSAHWIGNEGFLKAVENFLGQEKKEIEEEMRYLTKGSPFRKDIE
ncbi:MAG: N-acetyltransferase [Rhodospirillales bacterium]|nr:N-acetyltransferase [Rhodospirillales bacterium]